MKNAHYLPSGTQFGDLSSGQSFELLRNFRAFRAKVEVVNFDAPRFAAFRRGAQDEFVEVQSDHPLALLQTRSFEIHQLVQPEETVRIV